MPHNPFNSADFYKGLQSLADSSFPKQCSNCKTVYTNVNDYLVQTNDINGHSGLKQSNDDNGSNIVELYRNCSCGSTLLTFFGDRRDNSQAGIERRETFGQLLGKLMNHGIPLERGRTELLKVLRGHQSEYLNNLNFQLTSQIGLEDN